jgi:hypothetical protein
LVASPDSSGKHRGNNQTDSQSDDDGCYKRKAGFRQKEKANSQSNKQAAPDSPGAFILSLV